MKKNNIYLIITLLLFCSAAFGQKPTLKVGDNPATKNSAAALDVESTTKGFLPPRMTTAVRNAIATPAKGLVVYNTTLDCLEVNKGTAAVPSWECIGASTSATATVDCNTAGFVGTYTNGTALSGANYTVTITNNTFSTISLTMQSSDLVLSGITGLTVGTPSPATLNLAGTTSGTVTYPITGTPTSCGTLTGVWSKVSLTCTKTKIVPPVINCGAATWTTPVSPAVTSGLTNNTAYTGTYSIPYTGGGCTLAADSITQSGLTLAFAGGTLAATGNLVYTLSGTYTGTTGGTVSFNTATGCTVMLAILKSCFEIKTANSLAADGVYTIDPDGAGSAFGNMQAQCDMTTDGGGWTLIMNYVRPSNNTTANTARTTLPIIGSSTLGANEAGSATLWGHAGNTLTNGLTFTTFRFFGQTSGHGRIIHFKTTSGVSYAKTGSGSFTGLNTNFTALSGHTALIPGVATDFYFSEGNFALTAFPYFRSSSSAHWGAGANAGAPNRWEVDDFPNGPANATIHRIWVR